MPWQPNLGTPLATLLIQIVLIIIIARALGALARRLGQPSVIGEMAAGIALGPSLFGVLVDVAMRRKANERRG